MIRTANKVVREVLRAAEAAGARVEKRSGAGFAVYGPDGGVAWIHQTPSDRRFRENTRKDLRRIGVRIP